ncbi:Enzyme that catalyzes the fourth step in the histidine pathway, partial [Linderina pennispora]
WIARGAQKVIITSWLFPEARFSLERLKEVSRLVGRDRLVVDLSCRRRPDGWVVAMNKWQTMTDMVIGREELELLAEFCSEFLIHAADVEGLCNGIDAGLVEALAQWSPIPVTYAGGARAVEDLALVTELSRGKVDLTIGSALDIFGGDKIKFADCVKWNQTGQL